MYSSYTDELAKTYDIPGEIKYTCDNDCGIEPPQMRFRCADCEMNNTKTYITYPSLNCSQADLIRVLTKDYPIQIEFNGYEFNIYRNTGIELVKIAGDRLLEDALILAMINSKDYIKTEEVKELFWER